MQIINERKLRAKVLRKSFYEFFKYFWDTIVAEKFSPNWHIEYLCWELQILAERIFNGLPKEYDLVINISPGSSKSTVVSQIFPAWCWTNMPTFRWIGGSHSYDLSLRDSVACRDIVESEQYQELFPGIVLREDMNRQGLFVNTFKGGRLACSVGSKVTGWHGHCLGVDDPIDPESALSEADMKQVNRWMSNTLPSRGIYKSDTPMILVMQRLAQNDPSGEKLELMRRKARVRHICIPAEIVRDDDGSLLVNIQPPELIKYYKPSPPLNDGTPYPNLVMDPKRLNGQHLRDFHRTLGEYGYAGQYLQDPVPLKGAMFDITKLHISDGAPPRMVRMIRAWDKAATKDAGAYSAGVLMGLDKFGDYWILDVVRGQWTPTDREAMIKNTAKMDRKGAHGRIGNLVGDVPVEIVVEQEGGSGGIESTDNTIRNLAGFKIIGKRVTGKKEERAWAFASQVGVKDHVHVLNREWTHEYVQELRFFPHGRFKDQVDGSSLAFNRMARPKKKVGGGALGSRR